MMVRRVQMALALSAGSGCCGDFGVASVRVGDSGALETATDVGCNGSAIVACVLEEIFTPPCFGVLRVCGSEA